MTNKSKRKGSDWERQAVELLNKLVVGGHFKKIPGSGAIGTIMNEPFLTADIVGRVDSIPKAFKIECKTGYGGSLQFTLKKEWLDKVKQEAQLDYSTPMLIAKFLGSREGIKAFVVMDIESFADLINSLIKV
jgi:hypothetical protein